MNQPSSWSTGDPVVVRGPRPDGVFTLAAFAADLGPAAALLAPHTANEMSAVMTSLHYALGVVVRTVVEPFVADRMLVAARPDDVAGRISLKTAGLTCWVGDVEVRSTDDTGAAGAVVGELLAPVIATAARRAQVQSRVVELVVLDALLAQTRALARQHQAPEAPLLVETLVAATGFRSTRSERTVEVVADAGPPVTVPVPRVCCVLAARPSPHACPACPARGRAGLGESVAAWLAALDDAEFVAVAGRPRITSGRP